MMKLTKENRKGEKTRYPRGETGIGGPRERENGRCPGPQAPGISRKEKSISAPGRRQSRAQERLQAFLLKRTRMGSSSSRPMIMHNVSTSLDTREKPA